MYLASIILYNLILFILLIIIFPYYIYLIIKGKTRLLKNRFGFYDFDNNDYVWIHAASVGEVKIALRFIEELRKSSFEPVMLSVQTETGFSSAVNKLPHNTFLCYAPFDFKPIHCYLHYKVNIKKLILIETELWPTMIYTCISNKIPVYLINARISDKTYELYKKLNFLFAPLLNNMVCICAQNDVYKKRFLGMGCHDYKVKLIPNLKYDLLQTNAKEVKKDFLLGKKVFVSGSLRSGEEGIIINCFAALKEIFPDLVCVVAPRHMHNVEKIIDVLKNKNISYKRYTEISAYNDEDIIVVDTVGDLINIYKMADVVFVGGSLVDTGGHNILEPIALGKPVIFGEYMRNFIDEAKLVLENNAGVQVKNSEELICAVKDILLTPKKAEELSLKALNFLTSHQGGISKTVKIIFE
ncbi:MAG: glycosyltransferase N-terminal domain-containing protein [Elusimicrobiota bacterium]